MYQKHTMSKKTNSQYLEEAVECLRISDKLHLTNREWTDEMLKDVRFRDQGQLSIFSDFIDEFRSLNPDGFEAFFKNLPQMGHETQANVIKSFSDRFTTKAVNDKMIEYYKPDDPDNIYSNNELRVLVGDALEDEEIEELDDNSEHDFVHWYINKFYRKFSTKVPLKSAIQLLVSDIKFQYALWNDSGNEQACYFRNIDMIVGFLKDNGLLENKDFCDKFCKSDFFDY